MAYLVSQLRKSGNQTYMTPVTVSLSKINSPNTFGGNETFQDLALSGNFVKDTVYYLRFQVHKIPQYFYSGSKTGPEVSMYQANADSLSLQILLKNEGTGEDDETTTPPEIIGSCFVPVATDGLGAEQYSSFAFVFTPSKNFNRIGFRINRVSYDAINISGLGYRNWLLDQLENPDDIDINITRKTGEIDPTTGRDKEVQVTSTGPRFKYGSGNGGDQSLDGDVCSLVNLVNVASGWIKIGYQCRPGSLIVVNKQPIRLGRSGVYEINNGTVITQFMIASPGGSSDRNRIDAFLLDYAYKN